MLEHHPHLRTHLIDIAVFYLFSIQENLSACGFFEMCKTSQECGLSASGGTDKNDHVSLFHIKVDTIEDFQASETFLQILNGDHSVSTSFQIIREDT